MKLVLLRHGESTWNKENKFTGWTDVSLSERGIKEAIDAGKILKSIHFDIAFTSVLKRANETLKYVLREFDYEVPIEVSWKLNERHYGALQGLNKDEMKEKYGEKQVQLWRRSFDERPPLLTKDDIRYPGNNPQYSYLKENELPLGECLKDTCKRVIEYYNSNIKKELYTKNVLIIAHGNSLRALIMYLENIDKDDIMKVEIPTGNPLVYELGSNLNILSKEYLKNEEN